MSGSSPPCNLSPSHCNTKPWDPRPGIHTTPVVPISWVTSLRAALLLEAAFWLLRNKTKSSTSLKPGSGWWHLHLSPLNHLNPAEFLLFLLREKILQIPRVKKRGNHCGHSWKSVMEELGIHEYVRGIIHCPNKMCSSPGENTLHGTALCSSHPVSQWNCFEGVKGNNIPPERSRRPFL